MLNRKLEIVLMRGLPGSGKSTYCKAMVASHPNLYVRINRDSLRAMFNEPHSKVAEKLAVRARDALIVMALKDGKNVLVDDTNLSYAHHEAHIQNLMVDDKKVSDIANISVQDFTDVPLAECLRRNKDRKESVDEDVIRRMWREHILPKITAPPYDPAKSDAIICDIDGTLAKIVARSPYDKDKYHTDELYEHIRDILVRYATDHEIVLVSGREDDRRKETTEWLIKHGVPFSTLIMRTAGDFRNDALVKSELYQNYIAPYFNVKFVLDDRSRVVRAWRELGLPCLQVNEGEF